MSPRAPREYAIHENDGVCQQIQAGQRRYSRFHDAYDGLTWRLAKDPYMGQEMFNPLYGGRCYIVKSLPRPFPGYCVVTLVYTVEDQTITIHHMRVDPC